MAIKYVLTIGLFDKDTHQLEVDPASAQSLINNEVAKTFEGATVYSADGVYRHNDGSTVREPSIRVEVVDFKNELQEAVLGLARWAKQAFNQESVLYEAFHEEAQFI